jgi:hypothetical protein
MCKHLHKGRLKMRIFHKNIVLFSIKFWKSLKQQKKTLSLYLNVEHLTAKQSVLKFFFSIKFEGAKYSNILKVLGRV